MTRTQGNHHVVSGKNRTLAKRLLLLAVLTAFAVSQLGLATAFAGEAMLRASLGNQPVGKQTAAPAGEAEQETAVTVGSYVTFGAYPQTGAGDDRTPIEWLVLDYDAENNKALLISRYGLDAKPYNAEEADVTWENCSLRAWLNGEFFNAAFTEDEQKAIMTTDVDNSREQGREDWNTDSGNNTQDKVFLLSVAEAIRYFDEDKERVCTATDYAVQQGAYYLYSDRTAGIWWLRSHGSAPMKAGFVNIFGACFHDGMQSSSIAVRPALWLDLAPDQPDLTADEKTLPRGPIGNRPAEDQTAAPDAGAEQTPPPAVGSYVVFGTYPQTEAGDDRTPIEWLVLDYDAENNKALLVSRYGLDAKPYNAEEADVTWETCTLRAWLDGEFFDAAFTDDEKWAILLTNVDNGGSQGNSQWSTDGGNNTQDRIFLLSYAEAWKYFADDEARMCAPTDYAVKQGLFTSPSEKVDNRATGMWWLRSPGMFASFAASVDCGGAHPSFLVNRGGVMVRPALWITLDRAAGLTALP